MCKEEDLVKFLNDPAVNIKDFHIISEDVIVLEHCKHDNYVDADGFSNIAIAALTTTYARLHLLKALQSLDPESIIYCDTDSIVYEALPGRPRLQTGDFLGELTNELPEGTHIKCFMSTGPKSYCYKVSNGEIVLKIKGITLSHVNRQILNFDSLQTVLFEKKELKTPFKIQFVRDKYNGRIFNRNERKTFRLVFTKRILLNNFDTLPFGHE